MVKPGNLSELSVGLVSISDRASNNVYEDLGIPCLKSWLGRAIISPFRTVESLIPDDKSLIKNTLIRLIDEEKCDLVLTTGGTGPAPRDVTPDATLEIGEKHLPGFGEQMRQISLNFVPTAILSRQVAVVRKSSLIINLPGQPRAIQETLEGVRDKTGEIKVPGIFAAVPYGLELIGGPVIITDENVCKSFRPKNK